MRLVPRWKIVLRKAWSTRLALLSAGLSVAEVAIQRYAESDGTFAAAAAITAAAATVARIVAQPESMK